MQVNKSQRKKWTKNHYQLFIMALMGAIFITVFSYLPMFGLVLAFKDGDRAVNLLKVMFTGEWTMKNFTTLFADKIFWQTFWNTLQINLLQLVFGFPMPIIFALLMNELGSKGAKNAMQTICNLPHFLSWTVYGGIIISLIASDTGIVNPILELFGLSSQENPVDLNMAQFFYPKIIIASMLKGFGWGSIVYTAAIAGIDTELYEAAEIDGAGRWKRAMRITLPLILPTITVFLLLRISNLLSNSFEMFYVFESKDDITVSRVIATYVYELSFTRQKWSTSTLCSLTEGIISLVLLLSSNWFSKKLTGRGIF